VIGVGPSGSWNEDKVGRPSVLHDGATFHLWYDGTGPLGRHVGYATSVDGVSFTPHPDNPLFLNAGAIDVDLVDGVYVMVRESHVGTYWATSDDRVCWTDQGLLFGLSGAAYDAYGQVTPFLEVESGALTAVWYGGAQVSTWNENRIAAAYPTGTAPTDGGGCTACTSPGISCAEACGPVGYSSGHCGNPGSTDPGNCCSCESDGCDGCVVGAGSCHEACVNLGYAGGICAHPGSVDPAQCCDCLG